MATTDGADARNLRLGVLDAEDLAVVSAHLQGAEIAVRDMAYLPRDRRFAMVVARFDWPSAARGQFRRGRTGVHLDGVMKAARTGFKPGDSPLHLLAITFEPGEAPGGDVLLTFAGGARIRLTVECLDAEMRDLGDWWDVGGKPASPIDMR